MSNSNQIGINPETGTKYSRAELHAAFTAVQDKENWKNPIAAVIAKDQLDVTCEAIRFFAGCSPCYKTIRGGKLEVRAVGYYAAVGA